MSQPKTSNGGYFEDELRRADEIIVWIEDVRSPGKLIPVVVGKIPAYQKFIRIEFARNL